MRISRWHAIANRHGRHLGVSVALCSSTFRLLWRLRNLGSGRNVSGSQATKIFLSFGEYLTGSDIAHDGDYRVVRGIVLAIESLHVLDAGRIQVAKIAIKVV